jgi:uncharacterized glyoxalase superfamily protein PhnB
MPASSSRPAGAPQALPYLYYPDATAALAFLVDAFAFTELDAMRDENRIVWSAQVSTGDGVVLIGSGMDEFGTRLVTDRAWATARTFVYVDDIDGHYKRARDQGATISRNSLIIAPTGSTSRATAAASNGSSRPR